MLDFIRQWAGGEAEPPNIAKLLGFRLTQVEEGAVHVAFTAKEDHYNPMGTLHGGVMVDVMDAAMGLSYASTLEEGETFTTLELRINYLRPFWTGELEARGRLIHRGRTVGMAESDLVDEQGRLVAKATSTCLTLRGDKASGRGTPGL